MENHGLQCGYCTPGMVMAAVSPARGEPEPDRAATCGIGLEGNLCRCTGYHNIVQAVLAAARQGVTGMTVTEARRRRRCIGTPDAAPGGPAPCSPARPASPTTSTSRARCTSPCVRSPYAHARITVDRRVSAPLALPGVVAVYTGADLADAWAGADAVRLAGHRGHEEPGALPARRRQGRATSATASPCVLADSRRPRPATRSTPIDVDVRAARRRSSTSRTRSSDRVVIHDDLGTNTSYTWELKLDEDAVDAAFAAAAHTVKERYVQQRLIPMAMEPRAVRGGARSRSAATSRSTRPPRSPTSSRS